MRRAATAHQPTNQPTTARSSNRVVTVSLGVGHPYGAAGASTCGASFVTGAGAGAGTGAGSGAASGRTREIASSPKEDKDACKEKGNISNDDKKFSANMVQGLMERLHR